MSVYGEFDSRFRPRPGPFALMAANFGILIAAFILVPLIGSVIDVLVARSAGLVGPLALYAPLFRPVLAYSTPPLSDLYGWAAPISCLASLLLSYILTAI